MITEIPFTLAFLYPGLTYFWLYPKLKPVIEKEVEHEKQEMDGIKMEGYNMVSIGRMKILLSKHISKDKKKEYSNLFQIEDKADSKLSHIGTTFDYNQNALFIDTYKYYNILPSKVKFTNDLPLKLDYYNYKNGFYIHKSGYIASNKDKLVKEILWHKRLPLTMTIPAIAGFSLTFLWLNFAADSLKLSWWNSVVESTQDGMVYRQYYHPLHYNYPPFHYKRIEGYFTKAKAKTSNG